MSSAKPLSRTKAPKRLISKQQGLRHLIHAAIRMVFSNEDPFAIQMLAQSAEKMCLDLLKQRATDDPIQFEDRIRPEFRKAFFAIHRESYNFLKHADKDATETLPVHDIVGANDMLLFGCIARYRTLFGNQTAHMDHFFAFVVTLAPTLVKWEEIPGGDKILAQRDLIRTATRGDCLDVNRTRLERDPRYLKERRDDLIDVEEAAKSRLEHVRRSDADD